LSGLVSRVKHILLNYWVIGFVLGALLLISLIIVLDSTSQAREETKVPGVIKTPTPTFGKAEYVGSKRCKDCHWREYDAWKTTEYSIVGDFEWNNKLVVKVTDRSPRFANEEVTTTMFKKDGKFYVRTIGPDWEFKDYEVTNVIGMRRRQNYLTKSPNGEIYVLPVEWDIKKERWVDFNGLKDNYPGDGEYWSDRGSIWQFRCGGCHVTGLKINYDKSRDSFNSTWVDMGKGCEVCHGPGSNHVEAATVYFDYEKETIVNPVKLPSWLQTMVCGQCHNWGQSTIEVSPHKEGFPTQYGYPYGYLPGKPLYLYYREKPDKEKKHPRHYNEWRTSEHARVRVTCINCHGAHPEEEVVAITNPTSDRFCMDCHKAFQRRSVHRIHTFGSCIACHMPKTMDNEYSHTFRFISPAESIKAGGVDKQPNSCSGCHYHKDTPLENLVDFLDTAKKADMPLPVIVHGGKED